MTSGGRYATSFRMRLSIHGSRSLSDERVKILILEEVAAHGVTALVTHGEPDGVCRVARELCREIAMPLHLHYLNFKRKRGAFAHRTVAVLADCDRALFIHDGVSRGTSNELAMAIRDAKPHSLHTLPPARGPSQSFEDDADWAEVLVGA